MPNARENYIPKIIYIYRDEESPGRKDMERERVCVCLLKSKTRCNPNPIIYTTKRRGDSNKKLFKGSRIREKGSKHDIHLEMCILYS